MASPAPIDRMGATLPTTRKRATGTTLEIEFLYAGGDVALTARGRVAESEPGKLRVVFETVDDGGASLLREAFPGWTAPTPASESEAPDAFDAALRAAPEPPPRPDPTLRLDLPAAASPAAVPVPAAPQTSSELPEARPRKPSSAERSTLDAPPRGIRRAPRAFAVEVSASGVRAALAGAERSEPVAVAGGPGAGAALLGAGLAARSSRRHALSATAGATNPTDAAAAIRGALDAAAQGPLGTGVLVCPGATTPLQRADVIAALSSHGLSFVCVISPSVGAAAAFSFGRRWLGRRLLSVWSDRFSAEAAVVSAVGDELCVDAISASFAPHETRLEPLARAALAQLGGRHVEALVVAGDGAVQMAALAQLAGVSAQQLDSAAAAVSGAALIAGALDDGLRPPRQLLAESISLARADGSLQPVAPAQAELPAQRALELTIERAGALLLYDAGSSVDSAELVFHAELQRPGQAYLSVRVETDGMTVQLFDRDGLAVPWLVQPLDTAQARRRLIAAVGPARELATSSRERATPKAR